VFGRVRTMRSGRTVKESFVPMIAAPCNGFIA